jgi:hypothetical protein
VIALVQRCHPAADPFNNSRTLVAEQPRKREGHHLVLGADVSVANSRRNNPNDDLIIERVVHREIPNLELRTLRRSDRANGSGKSHVVPFKLGRERDRHSVN